MNGGIFLRYDPEREAQIATGNAARAEAGLEAQRMEREAVATAFETASKSNWTWAASELFWMRCANATAARLQMEAVAMSKFSAKNKRLGWDYPVWEGKCWRCGYQCSSGSPEWVVNDLNKHLATCPIKEGPE